MVGPGTAIFYMERLIFLPIGNSDFSCVGFPNFVIVDLNTVLKLPYNFPPLSFIYMNECYFTQTDDISILAEY